MESALPAGLYRNVLLHVCEILFVWVRHGYVSTVWLTCRIQNCVLISTNLVLLYWHTELCTNQYEFSTAVLTWGFIEKAEIS